MMALFLRSANVPKATPAITQLSRSLWGAAEPVGVPMTDPFPGVEVSEVAEIVPPVTKITTLPNGVRVASEDMASYVSTVGVYVDAGSRYEDAATSGASHMLQQMAFKSTTERSHFSMVRSIEMMGGNVMAASSRENIVYQADVLRSTVPEMMGLLHETVCKPAFLANELNEQKSVIAHEIASLVDNPQNLVTEKAHVAAYSNTLGKPLLASPKVLSTLTADSLQEFVAKTYLPSRMVVTGSGVDHDELVALATSTFGTLPATDSTSTELALPAQYVGGEYREYADVPATHFILTFEGLGWHDDDLVPLCTLNTLMGGGASFSAGGPGKGMYTRLYQNVLNQYHFAQNASVFNTFYNDSGLFGVYGVSEADYMGDLVNILVQELLKLTSATVPDTELNRAKTQLKSSLLMNLESRAVLFEDIGRQVLTYGKRKSPAELCAKIEAVTADDLLRISKKIMSTPPTVVVYGDTSSVPRYDLIAKAFA